MQKNHRSLNFLKNEIRDYYKYRENKFSKLVYKDYRRRGGTMSYPQIIKGVKKLKRER
mgnify:CR=1 FL=1